MCTSKGVVCTSVGVVCDLSLWSKSITSSRRVRVAITASRGVHTVTATPGSPLTLRLGTNQGEVEREHEGGA